MLTQSDRACSRFSQLALGWLGICCSLFLVANSSRAQSQRSPDEHGSPISDLIQRGVRIGDIDIVVENVFDDEDPEESKRLYQWANRVHVLTRESAIRSVLLFESGDPLDERLLRESARLLRSLNFLVEADIVPTEFDLARNTVDIQVTVRDAWNLSLDLKLSRSGGANEFGLGLDDSNLFGTGKEFKVSFSSDVDRDETAIGYSDPNVRGSRVRLSFAHASLSDGDRTAFAVGRPFYALDTRWSVGSNLLDDERIDPIYDLGETVEEFRRQRRNASLEGGWSKGLIGGRTRRWLFGVAYEQDKFTTTPEYPDPILLPPDRKLVYPWAGVQIVEDDFRVMTELNDMGRTEDIPLGLNLIAKVGFASDSFGSDRDATLWSVAASKGWEPGGPGKLLLFDANAATRRETDEFVNSIISAGARYYHRNLEKHLFSASLNATTTNQLDPDRQVLLGGDTGLRGYPLRYQSGEHKAVLQLEQRFYTDWYPLRLVRVAYAFFFDAGRVWGQDPRGTPSQGMLYDIGAGLRLSSPRASGRQIVHIDLAFPIRPDESVDAVQLVVGTKRSF